MWCGWLVGRLPKPLVSASIFLPTPCATAVLLIFWKRAPICVPFRAYSDIPDWSTLSSTYISRPSICRRPPIHSIPWKSPPSLTANPPRPPPNNHPPPPQRHPQLTPPSPPLHPQP